MPGVAAIKSPPTFSRITIAFLFLSTELNVLSHFYALQIPYTFSWPAERFITIAVAIILLLLARARDHTTEDARE